MSFAEIIAAGSLVLVLAGGGIAWFAFVRSQDRRR